MFSLVKKHSLQEGTVQGCFWKGVVGRGAQNQLLIL